MGAQNDLLYVVKAWFVKLSKISWISERSINMLVGVALTSGSEWKVLPFTPGSAILTNKRDTGDGAGVFYQQEFKCAIPCKNLILPDDLLDFDELCIVKAELANGKVCLIGSTDNPITIEHELQSDQDHVVVSFTRKSIMGLYYIS